MANLRNLINNVVGLKVIYHNSTLDYVRVTCEKMEQNFFINFRILASVKPFQKVNSKDILLSIEPVGYIPTWVVRWYRGDDRTFMLRRLNELWDEAKKKLADAKTVREKERILTHLHKGLRGLGNLKQTYGDDVATKAHLELLMDAVQDLLKRFNYEPDRVVQMNEFPESSDSEEEEEAPTEDASSDETADPSSSADDITTELKLGRVLN